MAASNPALTWRLATGVPETPDVYEEDDEDEDYADDLPPHWRDSRIRHDQLRTRQPGRIRTCRGLTCR